MQPTGAPFPYRRSQPGIPVPSSDSRHDVRAFGRAYENRVQGNLLAAAELRRGLERDGVVPFDQVAENLNARFLPLQVLQATYIEKIEAFGSAGAKLLIRSNPRRMSYVIANFLGRNLMMLSFDKPYPLDAGIGAGIPIGGCYPNATSQVEINDIWVFCNDPTESFPIWVLGCESGIAIAGNRR